MSQLALVQFYDQRQIGASVLRQSLYGGSVMHRQRIPIPIGWPLYNFTL
jgi:hypothetical protein